MWDKLLEQAKQEYSPKQRFIFLLSLAPIFLFLLPYFFIRSGTRVDQWLRLPTIPSHPFNLILGGLLVLPSWLLAMWANQSQFTRGRGTPVPVMATQQLIVQPPYTYCRNPMALGAAGMYLGAAILFQTVGGMLLVVLFSGILFLYIKRFEEKEMELRFGQPYLAYKKRTPFLIPRFTAGSGENHPGE